MSFEAINNIAQAEAEAKAAVAAAEQKARQLLADAQAAGKAAVEAAGVRAEVELKQLRQKAEDKTRDESLALESELANQKAALRAKAESRLEKAAALVVERIVNS